MLTVHDLKLACPAYTMMRGSSRVSDAAAANSIRRRVNRCIKGSLALSSLVMLESYVHRALRLYDGNVTRFVVPSRFVLDKLVEWGWRRERFIHIPNFVDVDRFRAGRGRSASGSSIAAGSISLKGVATLLHRRGEGEAAA